jgi:hypothetical protein
MIGITTNKCEGIEFTDMQKASEVWLVWIVSGSWLYNLQFDRLLLLVCIIGMFTRSAECEKLLLLRKTHETGVPLQPGFRGSKACLSARIMVLISRFLFWWRYFLCIPGDVFCISTLLFWILVPCSSCRNLLYYLNHFSYMIELLGLSCNHLY